MRGGKKKEIGCNFWLTFYSSPFTKKTKTWHWKEMLSDRPQNWLKLIGWNCVLAEEVNVTVMLNQFLLFTVTYGTYVLKITPTKHFYSYFLFVVLLKPTMNILKSGHLFSKVWEDNKIMRLPCRKFVSIPLPFPSLLVLPLFLVSTSGLGTCL